MQVKGYAAASLLMLALTTGCAQPSRPEAMVARPPADGTLAAGSLRSAISVGPVTGGQATSPLWTSQVDNAAFAEALQQSLLAHAMLDVSGRRLRVEAVLMNLSQPLAGFNMEVSTTVFYRVIDVASGRPVFERPIAASFNATFSSALVGVERLRLANEGAIRTNIAAFIVGLSEAAQRDPRSFEEPRPNA